jgi:hypothetical protein
MRKFRVNETSRHHRSFFFFIKISLHRHRPDRRKKGKFSAPLPLVPSEFGGHTFRGRVGAASEPSIVSIVRPRGTCAGSRRPAATVGRAARSPGELLEPLFRGAGPAPSLQPSTTRPHSAPTKPAAARGLERRPDRFRPSMLDTGACHKSHLFLLRSFLFFIS